MGQMAVLAGFFLVSLLLAPVLSGVATTVVDRSNCIKHRNSAVRERYSWLWQWSWGVFRISHASQRIRDQSGDGTRGIVSAIFGRVGIFPGFDCFVLVMILVPRFWPPLTLYPNITFICPAGTQQLFEGMRHPKRRVVHGPILTSVWLAIECPGNRFRRLSCLFA